MSTKRKVEKVGGNEVIRVKFVKRGDPSTGGGGDDCEERGGGGYAQLQNERIAADWQALLAIFPEEVWILVLNGINDPDTLTKLSNASPVFRNLLLPRRVQFLFPKVWDILGVKYHEATNYPLDYPYLEPQRPYSSPLPWKQSTSRTRWYTLRYPRILKLRMVCRAWCDAMDAWYQNHQFRGKLSNVTPPDIWSVDETFHNINFLAREAVEMYNLRYLERFMAHFEPTHSEKGVAIRNPFLGRAFFLRGMGAEGPRAVRFMELLRNLFSKYGHYLWYLGIRVTDTYAAKESFYSRLAPLLQLVPNLRLLDVPTVVTWSSERAPGWYDLVTIEGDGLIVSPDELSQLEAYNNLHPLPRLEHLRIVTARNVSRFLPPAWFQQLIGINEQLLVLEMGNLVRPLEDYNISPATVPNLSVLSVRLQTEEDFETLTSGDNHWRLKKLDLRLDAVTSMEWGRIFKRLEGKWGETLVTLILSLPHVESMEDQKRLLEQGGNLKLNLPRLTHLHLTIPNLSCLDFLLPMKDNLSVLDIKMNATYDRELQGELVKRLETDKSLQLLSRPDNPIGSNIWTLFPKLSRLQLNYNATSKSAVRNSKRFTSHTIWTLRRQEWRNWYKESYNYRRTMRDRWKIKCTCL